MEALCFRFVGVCLHYNQAIQDMAWKIFAFILIFHLKATWSKLSVVFDKYVPGNEEKLWTTNIMEWQESPCQRLKQNPAIVWGSLNITQRLKTLSFDDMVQYMLDPSKRHTEYMSHHHYNVVEDGKTLFSFAIPIEGLMALARDPRKCFNVNSEEFTQSKDFLLPLHRASIALLHYESSHDSTSTKEHPRFRADFSPKGYIFDAGATYYTDAGSPGIRWLVESSAQRKVSITNVVSWEAKPLPGDLVIKGVPEYLIPGFQYFNHPVSSDNSIWNPLNLIKKKCEVSDYVIFKLDIDTFGLEAQLVTQLKTDEKARQVIDDFFFEQHFRNRAMMIHGWNHYPTRLSDYYLQTAVPLRKMGFRLHYWP